MGGLGNQMFQISHVISQSMKNNVEYFIRTNSFTPMQAQQTIKYIDNIFNKINFTNDIKNVKRIYYPWKFIDKQLDLSYINEFYGYFQSSKNFYGNDDEIRKLFLPSEEVINKLKKEYPDIEKPNTLSLHVRRGDYLTIKDILPVINKTYIDKCVGKNGSYDMLFVFSDDKEWVRNNLNYENMIIVDKLYDYEELWLMSLCKNNILSNSSFSWWGAFLNLNVNKKVYAPSIWFGPNGEKEYSDIYEKNWELIKVEYKNGELLCY